MRTPIEALKEIRDRLTYFCLRTDGKYDPPWATELVGIIDEAVTYSHAVGNAAAMREALVEIRDKINKWYDDDYISHGAFSVLWDLCSDALSAPARNCDRRFASIKEARTAYCSECGRIVSIWDGNESRLFEEWLLAPAAGREGEGDGR